MNLLQRCLQTLRPSMMAAAPASSGPYSQPALNRLYELLFCDDAEAFAPRGAMPPAPWQALLYAAAPRAQAIRGLAENRDEETRVRALAFDWLRRHGHPVPARQLLGVILEVPLEGGLDVLAVYLDGSVRYLNHAGRPSIFEGPVPALQAAVARVLQSGQAIVDRIGPWDKPRLPAPTRNVRLNFIVSDGLYFGEGPMQTLQADAMAGPLLTAGTALLQQVVALASKAQPDTSIAGA